jgi:hypothetical protein
MSSLRCGFEEEVEHVGVISAVQLHDHEGVSTVVRMRVYSSPQDPERSTLSRRLTPFKDTESPLMHLTLIKLATKQATMCIVYCVGGELNRHLEISGQPQRFCQTRVQILVISS